MSLFFVVCFFGTFHWHWHVLWTANVLHVSHSSNSNRNDRKFVARAKFACHLLAIIKFVWIVFACVQPKEYIEHAVSFPFSFLASLLYSTLFLTLFLIPTVCFLSTRLLSNILFRYNLFCMCDASNENVQH